MSSHLTQISDNFINREEHTVDNMNHFEFWESFVNSFGIIFVSEVADNTFILLLFFSLQVNRFKLFLAASLGLVGMNCVAVILGHIIPLVIYRNILDWVGIVCFMIFGFFLLYKANKKEHKTLDKKYKKKYQSEGYTFMKNLEEEQSRENQNTDIQNEQGVSENSLIFAMMSSLIIGECGDRSQIVTISIAAFYELWGTLIGSSLAHIICILFAIFIGKLLSAYLSEKIMLYLGGILFFIFSFQLLYKKM
jgi:putative Ca2+/H+ antiporter (TMEM165/GDT1 family)